MLFSEFYNLQRRLGSFETSATWANLPVSCCGNIFRKKTVVNAYEHFINLSLKLCAMFTNYFGTVI